LTPKINKNTNWNKMHTKIIIEINNESQICIPSVQFTVKKKIIQMKVKYFQLSNLKFLVAGQIIK
jgi:hypothetical protein